METTERKVILQRMVEDVLELDHDADTIMLTCIVEGERVCGYCLTPEQASELALGLLARVDAQQKLMQLGDEAELEIAEDTDEDDDESDDDPENEDDDDEDDDEDGDTSSNTGH